MAAPDERVKAKARVQVLLEFPVNGTWPHDCSLAQVFVQARQEALAAVRKWTGDRPDIRIMGEPVVTAVVVQEPP